MWYHRLIEGLKKKRKKRTSNDLPGDDSSKGDYSSSDEEEYDGNLTLIERFAVTLHETMHK